MTIATVRRLAADIFNVGQNKVRISPDGLKEAEGALTRSDVKGLIDKGIISKARPAGRASTKRLGRTGHGRRRGTPVSSKELWMAKVRSQRKMLRALLESGTLGKEAKRALYFKVKSGIFRNKRAMLLYLKENKLVPADYEVPKKAFQKPAPKGRNQAPRAARKAAPKGEAKKAAEPKPAPKQAHHADAEAKQEQKQAPLRHEPREHHNEKKGEGK
jgi:large subunit ribosomal protein L19e